MSINFVLKLRWVLEPFMSYACWRYLLLHTFVFICPPRYFGETLLVLVVITLMPLKDIGLMLLQTYKTFAAEFYSFFSAKASLSCLVNMYCALSMGTLSKDNGICSSWVISKHYMKPSVLAVKVALFMVWEYWTEIRFESLWAVVYRLCLEVDAKHLLTSWLKTGSSCWMCIAQPGSRFLLPVCCRFVLPHESMKKTLHPWLLDFCF